MGVGTSARYELAPPIVARLRAGEELAEVMDTLTGQTDVRSQGGAMGASTCDPSCDSWWWRTGGSCRRYGLVWMETRHRGTYGGPRTARRRVRARRPLRLRAVPLGRALLGLTDQQEDEETWRT